MKKLISSLLISSMLIAPCACGTFANNDGSVSANPTPRDPVIVSAAKFVNSVVHSKFFKYQVIAGVVVGGLYGGLYLADVGIQKFKSRHTPAPKGCTHKDEKTDLKYKLPEIEYMKDGLYKEPHFSASPITNSASNVFCSSQGTFKLTVPDTSKDSFSNNGYISVTLDTPPVAEKQGLCHRLVLDPPKKLCFTLLGIKNNFDTYNTFYLKGPDYKVPGFKDWFKQFIPFLHSEEVSLLNVIDSKLPEYQKDFLKINYGIVLTTKDEEAILNFEVPKETDETKAYKDTFKLLFERAKATNGNCFNDKTNFDLCYLDKWTNHKPSSKPLDSNELETLCRQNMPENLKKHRFYTKSEIDKLKEENHIQKEKLLQKFANASGKQFINAGEVARLSLAKPEQTFRLVINNQGDNTDADTLAVLLSDTKRTHKGYFNGSSNLKFDFEYVFPLPERLQRANADMQNCSSSYMTDEVNAINRVSHAIKAKEAEEKAEEKAAVKLATKEEKAAAKLAAKEEKAAAKLATKEEKAAAKLAAKEEKAAAKLAASQKRADFFAKIKSKLSKTFDTDTQTEAPEAHESQVKETVLTPTNKLSPIQNADTQTNEIVIQISEDVQ